MHFSATNALDVFHLVSSIQHNCNSLTYANQRLEQRQQCRRSWRETTTSGHATTYAALKTRRENNACISRAFSVNPVIV